MCVWTYSRYSNERKLRIEESTLVGTSTWQVDRMAFTELNTVVLCHVLQKSLPASAINDSLMTKYFWLFYRAMWFIKTCSKIFPLRSYLCTFLVASQILRLSTQPGKPKPGAVLRFLPYPSSHCGSERPLPVLVPWCFNPIVPVCDAALEQQGAAKAPVEDSWWQRSAESNGVPTFWFLTVVALSLLRESSEAFWPSKPSLGW